MSTLNLALNSPKITNLAPFSQSLAGGVGKFFLLVLVFGGPTKGMTTIWGYFVILVVDEHEIVIFKPQIMLKPSTNPLQGFSPNTTSSLFERIIIIFFRKETR